jgi:anaphase-promoting complex subunit 5
LDSWRSGDYPSAFDYLHRYFDYTGHNKDRVYYQYGLLNLAVLQADFGCYQEAVAAMLETVSTARENRDMTCLNFALNWLFNFGRSHPSMIKDLETNSLLGSAKESLAFLRVKAKETGMFTLWSSVLLTEAKTGLESGDSVATSFEHMTRSSQLIVEKNMKTMFGPQMSLLTATWDRLGLAQTAVMTAEVFLRCHSRHAMFEDELRLTCKLALHKADRGKYDEALQALESIDENSLRSRKPGQYWFKYRGIVKLLRDLRHGYLDGAQKLLDQLLQSKTDELEPGLAFMIDTLHIDYLTRRGDLQAAFETVERLLSESRDGAGDVDYRIRLLLLKARLLDKCGRPQRGFSIAMRAASLAWRARLMTSLWSSMGALCSILVSMNEFASAAELLCAVLPRAIECDSYDLTARLYACLADANMGLAGTMPAKSPRKTEYMTRALGAVEKAFDYYSGIEDAEKQCEMMAKKAVIMKVSGDMVLAADYAAAYIALRKSAASLSLGGQ